MKVALEEHGLSSDTRVAVLADGGRGLAAIVESATGREVRSVLDWFHISMRLRPIEQMHHTAGGSIASSDGSAQFATLLPNLRHQMWNGRWVEAVRRMRKLFDLCEHEPGSVSDAASARLARFRRHILDLRDYLRSNWGSLANYADARRKRLRISSAPAESNMHHVVNQRMGKRQPMRWSAIGAHYMLQVRCAVLDRRLAGYFRQWYPRFRLADSESGGHCI